MKTPVQRHLSFLLGLGCAALPLAGHAKKYLISFRSPSEFQQLSHSLKLEMASQKLAVRNIFGQNESRGLKLFGTAAVMTQSLDNLDMAFVEVKDSRDLEILKKLKGN